MSGGQRVVVAVPGLGIEEPIAETPAPFVCQATLRPAGSEPLLTAGSKWLDIWCGRQPPVSITSDQGLLKLGGKARPYPVPNPDLRVISGVLIVDETWQHFETSGHARWGVRLPCGRVQLKGVDYRDARYGVRSCTENCLEQAAACQSRCTPSDELDACALSCQALEKRCLRRCAD